MQPLSREQLHRVFGGAGGSTFANIGSGLSGIGSAAGSIMGGIASLSQAKTARKQAEAQIAQMQSGGGGGGGGGGGAAASPAAAAMPQMAPMMASSGGDSSPKISTNVTILGRGALA
jgi:hypothetical protein